MRTYYSRFMAAIAMYKMQRETGTYLLIHLLVAMQGRQTPLPLYKQPAMPKVRTFLSRDPGDTISLARDTWPGWFDTAVRCAACSRLISRAYILT